MNLFAPPVQPLVLRPYQSDAVQAVYSYLRDRDDNPCVVIPTGGGKTPVIATICMDAAGHWGGRVLILAHVKELLEQAVDKLKLVCPQVKVGVYSAGLGKRETSHKVIAAGIQSVYRKAAELGHFDLVIVDEAHMIKPGKDGDGMFRTLLDDLKAINPNLRVIGLTATPFRMSTGPICRPAPDGVLNAVCYEIGVRELIEGGYLCPLRSKSGRVKADTSKLRSRGGEFVAGEVEQLMDQDHLVRAAVAEIIEHTRGRRSCLIFAAGAEHGKHVASLLEEKSGVECGFLNDETPSLYRGPMLSRFKVGDLKYLVNIRVLTTGFDAPIIDTIALLRPTMSPGLYYQMVGRGFRLDSGKSDCLVLDFGGNVMRHGPVDAIRVEDLGQGKPGEAPIKECPECQELIPAGCLKCPACGHEFPPPQKQHHESKASTAGILTGQVTEEEHDVLRVYHFEHQRRGSAPDHPHTLMVEYVCGLGQSFKEWICFEHEPGGFAHRKAVQWWRARSKAQTPKNVAHALELIESGAIASTLKITVRSVAGEKFDRIVGYELGPIPEGREPGQDEDEPEYAMSESMPMPPDDEIPF